MGELEKALFLQHRVSVRGFEYHRGVKKLHMRYPYAEIWVFRISLLFIRTTLGYKVYYPLNFGYIGKNVGYFGYISVSYSKKNTLRSYAFRDVGSCILIRLRITKRVQHRGRGGREME